MLVAILVAAALSAHGREERAAVNAVEAILIDPGSAQFRLSPARSTDHYCGFVNAKNRMGGYNGFEPFLVRFNPDGSVKIAVVPSSFDQGLEAEARQSILEVCAKENH